MVRFLSRILDRNKPLFVFNTRCNNDDDNGAGTPSFSMITLIQENDRWYAVKEFINVLITIKHIKSYKI